MKDITIVFYTLNKLPGWWQKYHREMLLDSADGAPIISISKEPMDLGLNVIQKEKPSMSNIYWQILRGCKLAETPFVAIAEDDTLYPPSHFKFRPQRGAVAYNRNRWALFTWGKPYYFLKQRSGNCVCVADRQVMVDALEERFDKFPDGLPTTMEVAGNIKERQYGLVKRKHMKFWTTESVVNLNHIYSHNDVERRKKKKPKPIRAYDIPYWGRADKIRKIYDGEG